jgi:hypothetical protein
MNTSRSSVLFLVSMAGLAGTCQAVDMPPITISGYGTAALTATDTDDAEFIRPNQASGATTKPRTGIDSNFGIQATAKFNDTISATAQGMVRKNGANDSYGGELAWAFIKVKASDDINVRFGRFALPIYMISDFRHVGYANTMIRPAAEVYRQVNSSYVHGADLLYQHSFDETTLTAQFAIGTGRTYSPGNSFVEFKPATTVHIVVENGPHTFRFGRADAKFDLGNNPTLAGLITTLNSVGFSSVTKQLPMEDIKGSFTSVGYGLDYKNFLVQAEYAIRKTESRAVMDTTSYYMMLGYRMDKVTPYYYHGKITQQSARSFPELPTTGPLAALSAGANSVAKSALQSANAIGVRWDFARSMALKVQVDRISPEGGGSGAFIKAKPGFTGPVNVYAAGIDFVF